MDTLVEHAEKQALPAVGPTPCAAEHVSAEDGIASGRFAAGTASADSFTGGQA